MISIDTRRLRYATYIFTANNFMYQFKITKPKKNGGEIETITESAKIERNPFEKLDERLREVLQRMNYKEPTQVQKW